MYWVWVGLVTVFSAYAVIKHGQDLKKLFGMWISIHHHSYDKTAPLVVRDLIRFANQHSRFAPGLELEVEDFQDNFLKYALRAYMTGAIRGSDLLRALRQSAEEHEGHDLSVLNELDSIRAFLPAMGWGTALLGLAWFFQADVGGHNYMASAGYVFAAVIAAVMYGLGLSYAVMRPLENKVLNEAEARRRKNQLVIEGVSLLMKNKSPFEIYEHLNLLLPNGLQLDLGEILPEVEARSA
jgi:flagellar motor component MotA